MRKNETLHAKQLGRGLAHTLGKVSNDGYCSILIDRDNPCQTEKHIQPKQKGSPTPPAAVKGRHL